MHTHAPCAVTALSASMTCGPTPDAALKPPYTIECTHNRMPPRKAEMEFCKVVDRVTRVKVRKIVG